MLKFYKIVLIKKMLKQLNTK